MKNKYLLLLIATVAITKTSFAQYSQDAIRFSGGTTGSTSRIKAIGNAQTAVGGDLSNISGNPAGLGYFTHSEMSITPEFNNAKVSSSYMGQSNSDSHNQGNLNNASIVFYSRLNTPKGQDKTKGWLSLNFGASYNRTNDFYQNTYYSGVNKNSSVADYYANLANNDVANNYTLDGYLEGWAYRQKLINNNANANVYEPSTTLGGTQANRINSTGGQTQFNLSMGANYSNKLYLGFGIGITDIRYNTTSVFTEDNTEYVNVKQDYVSNYVRDQVTRGTGFNATFGLIYKPVEIVRLGASITTPTWYNIDDNSSEGLNTTYSGGSRYSDGDSYPASYNLRTPLKVSGGAAVFIGHLGFITADVDYLDYSTAHLSSPDYDVSTDNGDIKKNYQSTVNARFGAEARLTSNFFLRGGYGLQGSPLKQNGTDIKTASGGLGYRFGAYYIDATYSHVKGYSTNIPYDLGVDSPIASLKNEYNNVFLTLGMRF
ncbi:OmpP1/FadL family transporter [Mucilaginibacter polytrichastri]|uniref:Uncharacterized protein n=1 Tax=Mucilaginibacter polytrichastri TaxID=1302689 RepID=A0A1Q5ZXQ7_9SPHI|nr:hypothetical protein [Mucilaginibacter polytrichastri]OKS86540.1 hypothetical protein RG47T_1996 [Mucilaginibacter polytrichastri]SFS79741.1 hypothetical protein SAMN04487890_104112 [Mucilaginibacter polytrichastri]